MGRGLINLVGQKFGKLTVVEEVERRGKVRYFHCKCECGGESFSSMSNLRSGTSKSCGCLRHRARVDKYPVSSGDRYGRWTVIREVNPVRNWRRRVLVKCDCGTTRTVDFVSIKLGHSKTCGCKVDRQKTQLEKAVSEALGACRRRDRMRGLRCTISRDDVAELLVSSCAYCGASPGDNSKSVDTKFGSIDRRDSLGGYTPDNVVPCCYRCNTAKNDMTVDEYVSMCLSVVEKNVPNFVRKDGNVLTPVSWDNRAQENKG